MCLCAATLRTAHGQVPDLDLEICLSTHCYLFTCPICFRSTYPTYLVIYKQIPSKCSPPCRTLTLTVQNTAPSILRWIVPKERREKKKKPPTPSLCSHM